MEENNVPKIKSNRGAMKRFKVTGGGKVKRLRQSTMVSAAETKNIRKLIPYL
jgi:ribosomal protein L35